MTFSPLLARAMWSLFEPIHAVSYFSPEARVAFEAVGLRGFWRGYFAGRAAPLGPVGPAPVIAIFSGFSPPFVRRALPAVWSIATPEVALDARAAGAVAALRRLAPAEAAVAAAAVMLEDAAAALDFAGRPLGAANADLPGPDEPYARLWQAATTLREHRGDGHVAAMVSAGLAGIDMLILRSALDIARELMQAARGWTDDEWAAAVERLTAGGLLAADGSITELGRARVSAVEDVTDRAASAAWSSLSPAEITLVAKGLSPIARACVAELPDVTPIGVFPDWDVEGDPSAASVSRPG
jgi:hypothetical protein